MKAVVDNQGDQINLEEADINDWIMKPKTIGKVGKKKTKIFIKVVTIQYLGGMIKPNIKFLKEE